MSQCPVCNEAIKDDFGLTECPGCGAQLLVHMDGRVEYQGNEEVHGTSSEFREERSRTGQLKNEEDFGRELEFDSVGNIQNELTSVKRAEDAYEPTQMKTRSQIRADLVPPESTEHGFGLPEDVSDFEAEPEMEMIGTPPADAPPPVEPVDEATIAIGAAASADDLFSDFDAPAEEPPAAVYSSGQAVSNSPNLSDVASFGNSEMSGGREGPLRYNLFIDGIDTVDVRESLREALTDRKLMWDTDKILRTIRGGSLSIPNIAPTKAYIVISRLRGMPVQVRWEQYAITQV